jgi:4-diphosphocytidyl-2-C-methyl-D-erythritol kinase
MPEIVRIHAPAKLNLALAVGRRLESGMHPIRSWMVTIDLCDELQVVRLPAGRLSRYSISWHRDARRRSDIDWSVSRDLAVRAHLTLQQRLKRDLPLQLRLEKRIPVGGGLGGGSSDAAAMLRAVNDLYELGLTNDELAAVGATIGSDVPFLVHGGSATVGGLGGEIEHHEHVPDLHIVLAMPEFGCDTKRVYDLFDELTADAAHQLRGEAVAALAAGHRPGAALAGLFNDLSLPATRAAPRLAGLIERLDELAERPSHVSGSGSSLFVVCDDEPHAAALAETAARRLEVATVAVRTIARGGAAGN